MKYYLDDTEFEKDYRLTGLLLATKPTEKISIEFDNAILKPMPRKDKGKHWHNLISKANTYVCGWNDCIDEILGETND